jgi:iron-sulfur cluster repair protein YtfE (RIC family)
MKRDPRLRQLSRDHHHALVLARRSSLAAADPNPNSLHEAWEEIVEKLDTELLPHFEIEERLLLPPLQRAGEERSVARVLEDHQALRRLVDQSPADLRRCLTEFGSLLTEHVRFEERVLFPLAESKLTDRELETIASTTPVPRTRTPGGSEEGES